MIVYILIFVILISLYIYLYFQVRIKNNKNFPLISAISIGFITIFINTNITWVVDTINFYFKLNLVSPKPLPFKIIFIFLLFLYLCILAYYKYGVQKYKNVHSNKSKYVFKGNIGNIVFGKYIHNVQSKPNKVDKLKYITIDNTPVLGKAGSAWSEPFNSNTMVQSFLDGIYQTIRSDEITSYTYGKVWAVKDVDKNFIFLYLASNFCSMNGPEGGDRRLVSEVGFKAGMRLEVICLSKQT